MLPRVPVSPPLFSPSRVALKWSPSETLPTLLLVLFPVLRIRDLRGVLGDKLPESPTPLCGFWAGGPLADEDNPRPPLLLHPPWGPDKGLHFHLLPATTSFPPPLNLTSPQISPLPWEVIFFLFCLFFSSVAQVPLWIMTKPTRVEAVSRNTIWEPGKGREMAFCSSSALTGSNEASFSYEPFSLLHRVHLSGQVLGLS